MFPSESIPIESPVSPFDAVSRIWRICFSESPKATNPSFIAYPIAPISAMNNPNKKLWIDICSSPWTSIPEESTNVRKAIISAANPPIDSVKRTGFIEPVRNFFQSNLTSSRDIFLFLRYPKMPRNAIAPKKIPDAAIHIKISSICVSITCYLKYTTDKKRDYFSIVIIWETSMFLSLAHSSNSSDIYQSPSSSLK